MFRLEKYSYRPYKRMIFLMKVRRNNLISILFRLSKFFLAWNRDRAADVASSYLATITWCAYPTWRRNEVTWHNGMCIGIPPPSPLDRCHVVRVFAGGCAWELEYGHRPMSYVHTPCTHRYAPRPPPPLLIDTQLNYC